MKRVLAAVLFCTLFLAACTTGGEKPTETGKPEETKQEEPVEITEETLQEFKKSLETSDDPVGIRKQMDEMMASATEEQSDAILADYVGYLDAYRRMGMTDVWNKLQGLEPYFDDVTEVISPDSITDSDLKALCSRMTDAGYKLIRIEGTVEPVVDYTLMGSYSDSISTEMEEYLRFKAMDSDKPWAKDAGIVIPVRELGERIAAAEGFLKKYPESGFKGNVLRDLGNYLNGYLGGLDNTPVTDGKAYSKEYLEAYEDYLDKHPDTKTAVVLGRYYADLKAKGFAAPYDDMNSADRLEFKWRIQGMAEGIVSEYGSVAENSDFLITTENLVIRSKPGTTGEQLYVIPKGTVVISEFSWKGWAWVHTSGWSGYSSMEYLKPVVFDPAHHRLTNWNVNLRESPGTDSPVLTLIPAQTIVYVDQMENGWGKTSYAGKEGYISLSLVKKP